MSDSEKSRRQGDPNIELVEVWTAQGEMNAQFIRSMLDSDGIEIGLPTLDGSR